MDYETILFSSWPLLGRSSAPSANHRSLSSSGTIADGAGLRLKLPAFVQQENCWIMPAFSPWSSGTDFTPDTASRVWLCSPERVLGLDKND
jgi:hypothetical protein